MIKINDICKSNKSNFQLYKVLAIENDCASCLGFDGYRYTIPLEDLEKDTKNSYVDISTLPDGTFFYVNNGCWQGYVTTENGVKVCYSGASKKNPTEEYVNRIIVSDAYELCIDIL